MPSEIEAKISELLGKNKLPSSLPLLVIIAIAVILLISFAGFALTMLFIIGGDASISGILGMLICAIPMGLLFIVGGIVLIAPFLGLMFWDKLRKKKLQISIERKTFILGDPINGKVTFLEDLPSQPSSLRIKFYGVTHSARHFHKVCEYEIGLEDLRQFKKDESIPFTFPMPEEAKEYVISQGPANSGIDNLSIKGFVRYWQMVARIEFPDKSQDSDSTEFSIISIPQATSPPK